MNFMTVTLLITILSVLPAKQVQRNLMVGEEKTPEDLQAEYEMSLDEPSEIPVYNVKTEIFSPENEREVLLSSQQGQTVMDKAKEYVGELASDVKAMQQGFSERLHQLEELIDNKLKYRTKRRIAYPSIDIL